MKILTANEIKKAILRCNPKKIAVAYIGIDWKTFIPNTNELEEIVLSPTVGTNPRAIKDLAKEIGWENVFFLNELHAKVYIGSKTAIIGSANLTSNGLSGENLTELCVEVKSHDSLHNLMNTFEKLKKASKKQYLTTKSKKMRLKELEKIWGAAVANKILTEKHRPNNQFSNFELLDDDDFYVLWYQEMNCKYSDVVKDIESVMLDDIHFLESDDVKVNQWVLAWRITDKSKPMKPYWLYIHEVFPKGVTDKNYPYSKLAIQRSDKKIPSPPFKITKEISNAFKNAVIQKNISKYLIQDDKELFNLKYSLKGIPMLIAEMKRYLNE